MLEYPKLIAFVLMCVLAYMFFHFGAFDHFPTLFHGRGYISMFFGGLLFSFGFTTPFAIGVFLAVGNEVNIFLGSLCAGLGAMSSDFIILRFARTSLSSEFHNLHETRLFRWFHSVVHHPSISERVRLYLIWSFAGLIIASPLPDEIAVPLLGTSSMVDSRKLVVLCFVFNTLGAFVILMSAVYFIG